jgi:hypothetical protein
LIKLINNYIILSNSGYDIDKVTFTSLDEDYCISLIESVMDLEDFAGWPFGR